MAEKTKHDQILDALQKLLEQKNLKTISINEIAQEAGMAKGSIYYYFPSKDAILEALVERSYAAPIETAKKLAKQQDIDTITRLAMIFQACQSSSVAFLRHDPDSAVSNAPEKAFLHQKYIRHLISELKPVLTEIINQQIDEGDLHFPYPEALAEIILIILTVKLDNTILPSSLEEIDETIVGLITLLENGAKCKPGSLNYLIAFRESEKT